MAHLFNPQNEHAAEASASPEHSRFLRSVLVGLAAWSTLIVLMAVCGGALSFFTGKAGELPKWNGWTYFVFAVIEGTTFGVILTWPLALIASVVAFMMQKPERKA